MAHLGLHVCAGWQLQGQLVVGLPGEARQFPGLLCEEILTLSPCAVVWEGFVEHLEKDKGNVGALYLCFPAAAQRKGAAGLLHTRALLRALVAWQRAGRVSPIRPCPAAGRPAQYYSHRLFNFCSLSPTRFGDDFPPLSTWIFPLFASYLYPSSSFCPCPQSC